MKNIKRVAIVYYSLEGNDEYVAGRLVEELKTDIDVIRLSPVNPYPSSGPMKFIKGGKAATFGEKPDLQPYEYNCKDYDLIIIGTPVWAGTFAPPIRTFLVKNKLPKKVAIFMCSSGGKSEKCLSKLMKYMKKSNIVGTLSLVDPGKSRNGDDLYAIRCFAENIVREK